MFFFREIDAGFCHLWENNGGWRRKKGRQSSEWKKEGVALLYVMHFASGDVCFGTHRNEIDEERNEHADQGVEYTVQGKAGNTGICAVCDRHTQECDTGNVGQGAFTHEIGKNDQWGNFEEFAFPCFSDHV